jgi:hypothetical protein
MPAQAGREEARAMGCGVKAALAVAGGAAAGPPACLGHLRQGWHARGAQDPSGRRAGRAGNGRNDVALGGRARDAVLPLLGCGPRVPAALAPVVAPVVVPAPCRRRRARGCAWARCAPLATTACPSAPAAAPWAQTVELVV